MSSHTRTSNAGRRYLISNANARAVLSTGRNSRRSRPAVVTFRSQRLLWLEDVFERGNGGTELGNWGTGERGNWRTGELENWNLLATGNWKLTNEREAKSWKLEAGNPLHCPVASRLRASITSLSSPTRYSTSPARSRSSGDSAVR